MHGNIWDSGRAFRKTNIQGRNVRNGPYKNYFPFIQRGRLGFSGFTLSCLSEKYINFLVVSKEKKEYNSDIVPLEYIPIFPTKGT